ncbi:MAG: hypothetical protein V7699_07635 [Porticoccus sp.]
MDQAIGCEVYKHRLQVSLIAGNKILVDDYSNEFISSQWHAEVLNAVGMDSGQGAYSS